MKKIMSGNEAIARGAYEAGCTVAAAYPGTPSTEILENVANYKEINSEWSPNEKVALEVGCGAAIGGARTLVAMKHVGLNVAADPFFTIAYEGVNGGLVVISADEPGMHSSQNEQDNRLYAPHAKVCMIEPSDSMECLDYIKESFKISEEFDVPVMFRVTTRICHSKGLVTLSDREEVGVKKYEKNVQKYAMMPAHARARHVVLEENLDRLRAYSNKCSLNRMEMNDTKIGIITSGVSYQHAKEVFGEEASYLKLGLTFPMPDKLIKEFADKVDEIYVIEENEPYIENFVKAMGIKCTGKEVLSVCGELNPHILRKAFKKEDEGAGYDVDVSLPKRPPMLCAGCPHRGIFYAMSKYKDLVVSGDIGCYTLGLIPPLNVTDTVICMGAGFSAAIGLKKAFQMGNVDKKVFGVVGDSTFFHSGITGLIDAVYNKTPITLVILDNSITAMTGHQENPGTGKTLMGEITEVIDIEAVVKACGIKEENVVVVDPYDLEKTREGVEKAYNATEPFVLITKRPCALIKEVRKERAHLNCEVVQEKCKKCRMCLKIGCPAITLKDGDILIDKAMCNGCELCKQVCKFDSIVKVGE
ncbi:indolepyruvate ferredoxin oxidoreductase subunit alpha [Anaeromicrobium sediminis]|uniref:Indolepyruvate oxidoreductase subunit IorA n=1 Tax=Anaeromicrobium sediminis TaxID=1478221 RepID=A0A267MJH8_9FIRM|nr:indolepyruvate ferredoxin oxidoreductase subunit alpha [Anaeromicrobium sediminis]PAB59754.1 indolepyruvate ferredoxin oxidoreductase subunit alpha [Anaeromicrobium sediminis]